VLICSERKVLLLIAGGRFVLREKYCWLVADKPNEQAGSNIIPPPRTRRGEETANASQAGLGVKILGGALHDPSS
jgi:hypothetical protein